MCIRDSNMSSDFLHFFSTKMQTGIPVEKKRLAGNPITASRLPSFNNLVLIFFSTPPRNNKMCIRDSSYAGNCRDRAPGKRIGGR